MMYAARGGHGKVVQLLLKRKGDPNLPDVKGSTALRQALRSRSPPTLALLLKAKVDVDQRDPGGRTPLMLASSEGDGDAVRMLLRMGAKTEQRCMGFTALVLAVGNQNRV